MTRIHILNTYIDNLSNKQNPETHSGNDCFAESNSPCDMFNAGKIVALQKDIDLRESVNSSDLINADGQAVVWAAKFLNKPLKVNVLRESTSWKRW